RAPGPGAGPSSAAGARRYPAAPGCRRRGGARALPALCELGVPKASAQGSAADRGGAPGLRVLFHVPEAARPGPGVLLHADAGHLQGEQRAAQVAAHRHVPNSMGQRPGLLRRGWCQRACSHCLKGGPWGTDPGAGNARPRSGAAARRHQGGHGRDQRG
ncbi:unnamed protein product, partial [Effrenium voratum]